MSKDTIEWVCMIVIVWTLIGILFSGLRTEKDNCDKTYPVDYIIYTQWFCEIKE